MLVLVVNVDLVTIRRGRERLRGQYNAHTCLE